MRLRATAFESAAPKLWNSLPDPVRNAETVGVFRQGLKMHFFNKKIKNQKSKIKKKSLIKELNG